MSEKRKKLGKRKIVENWLLMNKDFLHIKAIEREVKIPENTIQKYTKKGKTISTRRITSIHKWMLKLCDLSDKEWFVKHQKCLNITRIEAEINVKNGTLQKFIKYNRSLKKEVSQSLFDWQDDFLNPIYEWKSYNNKSPK
ncbi:hypothetical protein [Aquimarina algicola]|uniref:Uncharacterized protein n=1 Tax=Aquimarina algicola TaxID=2589995 RepID=A0A504J2V1_9FLAO|nr:hypothetical protein [Aquimarina algicola]TPN82752.1 hypothetical protein FHK87_20200 [Aquimarina algicola]